MYHYRWYSSSELKCKKKKKKKKYKSVNIKPVASPRYSTPWPIVIIILFSRHIIVKLLRVIHDNSQDFVFNRDKRQEIASTECLLRSQHGKQTVIIVFNDRTWAISKNSGVTALFLVRQFSEYTHIHVYSAGKSDNLTQFIRILDKQPDARGWKNDVRPTSCTPPVRSSWIYRTPQRRVCCNTHTHTQHTHNLRCYHGFWHNWLWAISLRAREEDSTT